MDEYPKCPVRDKTNTEESPNSGAYFVNEIELYVVNYLLFAPTRFASAGNGHLKREPAVAFTCSIVYEIQSSRITPIKVAKLT